MEKPVRYKSKNKKPAAKPKTTKKRKSDGPTCSMFLAEIARKLAAKKRQEEEAPTNIIQSIIESVTNALPFKFTKKSSETKEPTLKIENLQALAPELLPNDTLEVPHPQPIASAPANILDEVVEPTERQAFKMPKMPLVSSEVLKIAIEKRRRSLMQDASMNTGTEHDMASELVKHVSTLKKISLIAEEFNQKSAKNLKEIVNSVQEDLMKKLEEIQAEQKAQAQALQAVVIKEDEDNAIEITK